MAGNRLAPVYEVARLDPIEECYRRGWTDGLPVVPPTVDRVTEMLDYVGLAPDLVLGDVAVRRRVLTAEQAAANAVMAGCLPEYFPVIVAAFEAMQKTPFTFHGSTASTGGSAPLLIVSGPVVDDIGMNAGVNLFGPGNRANATIGRAVRLIILNVFRMTPGIADKSTQGNPGKYSFCIAERADANPWPALNEELGYGPDISCVVTFAGAGFNNVENHGANSAEAILTSMADSMANLGCITFGQSVVVLSPEHVRIIANQGWSKSDVQTFLYDNAYREIQTMKAVGKYERRQHAEQGLEEVHRGYGPEDILVTVGGGDAGGHSSFIPSWSRGRASIMQHQAIGVCIDC